MRYDLGFGVGELMKAAFGCLDSVGHCTLLILVFKIFHSHGPDKNVNHVCIVPEDFYSYRYSEIKIHLNASWKLYRIRDRPTEFSKK